ncbi:MAG TPA: CusA/CzcA family heavy metal efflux RND transporter [Cyclobacteriaceae bacterium]|nr:CusA/CzcA family heavy metal efflux RND transporter [Cyclobacteriaceae bacterium]
MLDKIILYSIRHKLLIGLLTVGLGAWGGYSLTRLPIDAVPDITNNQVQVITIASSQSALDIERLVTFPVEQTMATIPDIEEIRSFSRFGLSVVTIVFHDNVDVYWARQQVNERLTQAANQIPPGVGAPEMAPVTTGLGEIYQYIIRPAKGYEDKYDAMELRSIQDWIVRRQLLGTPGVADVASFGGYLKQYEIALDPDKLRSFNLGITDVFTALEKNNQNTGGAYIDKKPTAWFIRSEGLINTLDDIEKIVVSSTKEGIPILIRNVAEVQFGHATRYGAMTYNDEGEVVGAVTMMLKGENSSAVVNRVKKRIEQIQKTLPEGVIIEAFLDRSLLVERAVGTVITNLIEGALIVIAVLVLFLGNFRAGLIVASVIPLAMLFAVSMMNVFGVSGNLMSLGAIDFGLIVDGAVIIVEATMHHLGLRTITKRLTQSEMDHEVYQSASKIRNSAAFGEIIILIVYLPILALVGIEGKMFKPMAQTVSFAILGAFILSLTYVPMMSALFLSKDTQHKRNISDRMMDFFQRIYKPALESALHRKFIVVITAFALFVVSLIAFSRMGGEFLPTLEEGDFAVETRVLTGSSLSYTVEATSKGAEIILREFPDEVREVVGKIGTSEIPTDPMPLEGSDLMVILKDKSEWKKASSREELAEKMGEALEDIPGVAFGFQQPIQMRFNELMTGVRQDVAIKIFGEDLDVLTGLSKQVAKVVNTVEGARDLYVEEVTGLSQIVVKINRDEVAKYGLDIESVNEAINTAFAGQIAGLVFEGERRYELVVRFVSANRQSIEDVRNLFVSSPRGEQIPLKQLADVDFRMSPNQIQREDAKRRIIVGFNVRGRDVASIVKELQQKIDAQIDFPPGYYPTYGGQFENLKEAQARLSIAVPIALLLILFLLFFTFGSVKQSILIFMAIPMAAIGGVIALLLRGMPFSISAGIGFIALFGVAVLNGIVLIAEFNRLKKDGLTDLYEIVRQGTQIRLRPVLMTATVASLGFLPMALATSAGAEVQKPLATVVIGGLISSTLLTLIVIPCLYIYSENMIKMKNKKVLVLAILIALTGVQANAQSPLTLPQAIELARKNNQGLQASAQEVESQRQLKKTSFDLPKTNVSLMYGQYNSYAKNDNNITITQSIPLTVFGSKGSLNRSMITASELKKAATENELVFQVRQTFYDLSYLKSTNDLLHQQDSIYEGFLKAATLRYKTGETKLLEQATAETQRNEIKNLLAKNEADQLIVRAQLKTLINSSDLPEIVTSPQEELILDGMDDSTSVQANPSMAYMRQQIEVAKGHKKVEAARAAPEILLGFFSQTLIGTVDTEGSGALASSSDRFTGFEIGLAVPLWFVAHQGKVKAAEYNRQAAETNYQYFQKGLQGEYQKAIQNYQKNRNSLTYYKESALPNAALILKQSQTAYRNGEIGYAEYLLGVQRAITVKEGFLLTLKDYNQSIIYLEFLSGNK